MLESRTLQQKECYEKLIDMARLNLEVVTKFNTAPSHLKLSQAKAGQIWMTKKAFRLHSVESIQKPQFVLLLKGPKDSLDVAHPDVIAALLTPEYWMATHHDLILPADVFLVGGSMVCFQLAGPILMHNLDKYVTTLNRNVLEGCERVWQRADGIDVEHSGEPLRSSIFSNTNIRCLFHEEIKKETNFLWCQPAID